MTESAVGGARGVFKENILPRRDVELANPPRIAECGPVSLFHNQDWDGAGWSAGQAPLEAGLGKEGLPGLVPPRL